MATKKAAGNSKTVKVKDMQTGQVGDMSRIGYDGIKDEKMRKDGKLIQRYVLVGGKTEDEGNE